MFFFISCIPLSFYTLERISRKLSEYYRSASQTFQTSAGVLCHPIRNRADVAEPAALTLRLIGGAVRFGRLPRSAGVWR
jgi:hypothetical protein